MFQFTGVPNPGKWPVKDSGVAPRFNSKSSRVDNGPSTIADKGRDSYPDPDIALISELIEHISRNTSAVEAREVLLQQYNACGWFSGAKEVAENILELDPFNREANACLDDDLEPSAGGVRANAEGVSPKQRDGEAPTAKRSTSWKPSVFPISSPSPALRELEEGYNGLLKRARILHEQAKLWHDLKEMNSNGTKEHLMNIAMLAQGKLGHVVRTEPLKSVKDVAKAMTTKNERPDRSGFDIAYEDLEGVIQKLSSKSGQARTSLDDNYDTLRDALIKRVNR